MMARWMMAACVVVAVASRAEAQQPTLATVLERAGTYVTELERRLSGIVAEERYRQEWTMLPRGWPLVSEQRYRDLVSDLLLVKLASEDRWVQFRDVYEVDGAPVRDRSDRLVKLFLERPESAGAQLTTILAESARYNIGNIIRTVNTPTVALAFLEPANQRRFRFFRANDRPPAAVRDRVRLPPDAWAVRYEETGADTFIKTTSEKRLPSHGRFWIEPATGQVLVTELIAEDRAVRATIDVVYRDDPAMDLALPVEMRERYEGRTNRSLIEGVATYGGFRQFTVNVDETFLVKK
jgi:hypothetical protein